MKIFAIIVGVVILAAAAILWACLRGVDSISKEEDRRAQMQIEDDRLTCGLIEGD